MKKLMVAIVACAFVLGIALAFGQSKKGRGGQSKITMYGSNGFVIQEWVTPYEVEYENGRFSFYGKDNDHLIQITGTVIVDKSP